MVTFDEALDATVTRSEELLALDDALHDLARMHPRQAQMVEYRFFGGLDLTETAELLDVSESTLLRDWRAAKAWLSHELRRAG
jgi:DNA-directed RNA polymerase specialized sigma24 family protein